MASERPDLAERIAWCRAHAATVMAMVFIAAQAGSFHDDLPLDRPQALHLSAWIVWAAALLRFGTLERTALKSG
jgi:hypothetical protein